jgi:hypothetical protein
MILLTAISLTACAAKTGIMTAQVQVPGSAAGTVSYDGAATSPSSPSVSEAYTCIDTRTPCLGSVNSKTGVPDMQLVVPFGPGGDNTMVSRLIEFKYLQPGSWSLRATIATPEKRTINFCNIPVQGNSKTALTIFMQNTPPNATYQVDNGAATPAQPCQ